MLHRVPLKSGCAPVTSLPQHDLGSLIRLNLRTWLPCLLRQRFLPFASIPCADPCQTQGGLVCCTSGTTCQAVPGTGFSTCVATCITAVSRNGGEGDFTATVNIGVGNSFVFQYDARDYPDRFTVKTPSGQVLFNIQAGNPGNPSPSCTCSLCTGVTEPNGQVSLVPPLGVSQVIVVVNGQCSGTVWSFRVGCATTSNPLARTASVSALAPMPELPEEPFLLE